MALGALAMGLNAAEGIVRTFGLGSKQDMADADEDADKDADLEYDAEDEDDIDWEEEGEARESPAEGLMSATDQLAVSIMEAQVRDTHLRLHAQAARTSNICPEPHTGPFPTTQMWPTHSGLISSFQLSHPMPSKCSKLLSPQMASHSLCMTRLVSRSVPCTS